MVFVQFVKNNYMKTNDLKIQELKEKLDYLESNEEKLNMIWMWISQKRINLKIFKNLINSL